MKYLRRLIWYLTTRLLVVSLIAGLMITVFYYAMNLTNIQIILKDGMAKRAQYIMGIDTDQSELKKYFQASYLTGDAQVLATANGASPYADYNIRGLDHRLEMEYFWVWPWSTTADVQITESVPRIDGRVKGLKADEVVARKGQNAVYPPEWQTVTYQVKLKKETTGQWKVVDLKAVGP